jgi:hypothetical protein
LDNVPAIWLAEGRHGLFGGIGANEALFSQTQRMTSSSMGQQSRRRGCTMHLACLRCDIPHRCCVLIRACRLVLGQTQGRYGMIERGLSLLTALTNDKI